MAINSEPSLHSHPAPSAEELPPSDEQTPLLKPMEAVDNGTPAGIPVPGSRDDDAASSGPKRLPQAIAHRGYKVVAPENSMLAFRAAAEVGAHAIETDLHLSKDGVVVLSHDGTLKRCFGEDTKVKDRDWKYLSTLRTVRKPAQPMPRLLDLLEYLNQPGLEHVWVMLDIKRDDDPTEIIRRTAETIASVKGIRPWSERILPCCWTAQYIKLCKEFLPGFPIAHVGGSHPYARALAEKIPGLHISFFTCALAVPGAGPRFVRDMKRAGHPLYAWTVNDEAWMAWSIRQKLDGVITDDPKLFLEVCGRAAATASRPSLGPRRAARELYTWAMYCFFTVLMSAIYFYRWGLPRKSVRKTLES